MRFQLNLLYRVIRFPISYWKRNQRLRRMKRSMELVNKAIDLKLFEAIIIKRSGVFLKVKDGREFEWRFDMPNSLLTIPVTGTFEQLDSDFVRRNVKAGSTVIDCGANFGWYTTLLSKIVGSKGMVHSFEPVDSVRETLIKHVEINGCQHNVKVNRYALGEVNTKRDFWIPLREGAGTAFASFEKQTWGNYQKLEVEVITLDEYVAREGIEKIDFIKCDVEGAEFLVLKGIMPLLEKGMRPIFLLEVVPSTMKSFGVTPKDIADLFAIYDYEILRNKPSGEMERINNNFDENIDPANYIFRPRYEGCIFKHERICYKGI